MLFLSFKWSQFKLSKSATFDSVINFESTTCDSQTLSRDLAQQLGVTDAFVQKPSIIDHGAQVQLA